MTSNYNSNEWHLSLKLIVESFSTRAKQATPAAIRSNSFKLIDTLASDGASNFDKKPIALASEGAQFA
jgi:hypothetical protein